MPSNPRLTQLLAQRDTLAEASSRALAHSQPDADQIGTRLGDLEALLEMADPHTYGRLIVQWLQHDATRLEAHLSGTVADCTDCQRERQPASINA